MKGRCNMNKVHLKGIISDRFIYGEGFWKSTIMVMRDSGDDDLIPIVVESPPVLNGADFVEVFGRCKTGCVYADEIITHDIDELEFVNEVELSGIICRKPNLRVSPKGKELSDFIVAVGNDYIPCIAWGMSARRTYMYSVGLPVEVKGRFQSREYLKKTESGTEKRTAYEVSARTVHESVENR